MGSRAGGDSRRDGAGRGSARLGSRGSVTPAPRVLLSAPGTRQVWSIPCPRLARSVPLRLAECGRGGGSAVPSSRHCARVRRRGLRLGSKLASGRGCGRVSSCRSHASSWLD